MEFAQIPIGPPTACPRCRWMRSSAPLPARNPEDMRDKGYFSHTSPTYGSVSDMLKTFGYSFSAAGENIAHASATVAKAQAAFMSSSGHKRNILGSSWTKVGIGVCYDANGYVYVTQIFAR